MPTPQAEFRRPHPRRRQLFGLTLGLLGGAVLAAGRETIKVEAGDDQTINRALAALPDEGGVIVLGRGTFRISQPVVIDRDDVELRGQGRDTVLQLMPGANCPVLVIGSLLTPPGRVVRHVTVRNLLVDGNREGQQFECYGGPCDGRNQTALRNNGLTIRGAEDILVAEVVTRHARSGGLVLEKHCRRVRLERFEAYDNEFDGVAAYETEDSDFNGLNLHHNRSAGFSFDWRFNHNRVADTVASDNGSQGIFMRDSIGNTFDRVTLRGNGEQGIFIAETRTLPGTACRYNRFRSAVITGNKTQGIRINDASCNPNTVEECLVKGNQVEDISLADFGQLEILRPRDK